MGKKSVPLAVRSLTKMESPTFLHDLVESTKADLVVGETWCIVSMEWWKQVLEALAEGLENADLPDVDNLNLCDNTNQEEGENDAVLRPGLKEDIDYKLVPESTWEMLHERFVPPSALLILACLCIAGF